MSDPVSMKKEEKIFENVVCWKAYEECLAVIKSIVFTQEKGWLLLSGRAYHGPTCFILLWFQSSWAP